MGVAHYAKAFVAILGAGITAALGIVCPDDPVFAWLTIAAAVVTAAGVYAVPNADPDEYGRYEAGRPEDDLP